MNEQIVRLADVGKLEMYIQKALKSLRPNVECIYDEQMCQNLNLELNELNQLPTIDPESLRPTGHWIESICLDDAFWVCSNCKFPSQASAAPELYHYCPNCGARMEDME